MPHFKPTPLKAGSEASGDRVSTIMLGEASVVAGSMAEGQISISDLTKKQVEEGSEIIEEMTPHPEKARISFSDLTEKQVEQESEIIEEMTPYAHKAGMLLRIDELVQNPAKDKAGIEEDMATEAEKVTTHVLLPTKAGSEVSGERLDCLLLGEASPVAWSGVEVPSSGMAFLPLDLQNRPLDTDSNDPGEMSGKAGSCISVDRMSTSSFGGNLDEMVPSISNLRRDSFLIPPCELGIVPEEDEEEPGDKDAVSDINTASNVAAPAGEGALLGRSHICPTGTSEASEDKVSSLSAVQVRSLVPDPTQLLPDVTSEVASARAQEEASSATSANMMTDAVQTEMPSNLAQTGGGGLVENVFPQFSNLANSEEASGINDQGSQSVETILSEVMPFIRAVPHSPVSSAMQTSAFPKGDVGSLVQADTILETEPGEQATKLPQKDFQQGTLASVEADQTMPEKTLGPQDLHLQETASEQVWPVKPLKRGASLADSGNGAFGQSWWLNTPGPYRRVHPGSEFETCSTRSMVSAVEELLSQACAQRPTSSASSVTWPAPSQSEGAFQQLAPEIKDAETSPSVDRISDSGTTGGFVPFSEPISPSFGEATQESATPKGLLTCEQTTSAQTTGSNLTSHQTTGSNMTSNQITGSIFTTSTQSAPRDKLEETLESTWDSTQDAADVTMDKLDKSSSSIPTAISAQDGDVRLETGSSVAQTPVHMSPGSRAVASQAGSTMSSSHSAADEEVNEAKQKLLCLRRMARDTLNKGCQDGRLATNLEHITTPPRSSRSSNLDVETLRRQAKETFVQTSNDGRLLATLEQVKSPSKSQESNASPTMPPRKKVSPLDKMWSEEAKQKSLPSADSAKLVEEFKAIQTEAKQESRMPEVPTTPLDPVEEMPLEDKILKTQPAAEVEELVETKPARKQPCRRCHQSQ